jgi:hypothetical protein
LLPYPPFRLLDVHWLPLTAGFKHYLRKPLSKIDGFLALYVTGRHEEKHNIVLLIKILWLEGQRQ